MGLLGLRRLLEPPRAFFEPQRAEGRARLQGTAGCVEPQCHPAECFSSRACSTGPVRPAIRWGRPAGGQLEGGGRPGWVWGPQSIAGRLSWRAHLHRGQGGHRLEGGSTAARPAGCPWAEGRGLGASHVLSSAAPAPTGACGPGGWRWLPDAGPQVGSLRGAPSGGLGANHQGDEAGVGGGEGESGRGAGSSPVRTASS